MARGAKYNVYNELRIYSNAAQARTYSTNHASTIYPNTGSDSGTYKDVSSVEGKGNAYVDTSYGLDSAEYPAFPVWWVPHWGGSGYLIGWTNDSKNLGKSVPTLNKASMDLGETVRITFNRLNSSFTHKVWYRQMGGSWVVLASGVTATYWDWTPSRAGFLPLIPSSTSSQFEISVETFNGSQNLGENRVSITLKVPTDVVPTMGNITVVETDTKLKNTLAYSGWVKGVSKPKASVSTVSPGEGAGPSITYAWSFSNQTSSAESPTFSPSTATSVSVALYVVDARGRKSATKYYAISQVNYSPPSISLFTVKRYNPSNQNQVNFDLKATQTKLSNKNTMRYKIDIRVVGGSSWSSHKAWSSYQVADFNLSSTAISNISNTARYELRVTVEDLLGNSSTKIFQLDATRKKWISVKKGETANLDLNLSILGVLLKDFIFSGTTNTLKFKDGIMIQWGYFNFNTTITSPWGSVYYSNLGTDTFHESFIRTPYLWPFVNYTSGARVTGVYQNTAASVSTTGEFHIWRPDSSSAAHRGSLIWLAIGYWK